MALSGPFLDPNVFIYAMINVFETRDVFSLATTCRQNNEWSKDAKIWEKRISDEGIPQVVKVDGSLYEDQKQAFRILCPITLSARKIGEVFGEVTEKVPQMKDDLFEKIAERSQDYQLVVKPSYLQRTNTKEVSFSIDSKNRIVEVLPGQVMEQSSKIPLSLYNFRVLCENPLQGEQNGPVFAADSWETAFKKSTSSPKEIEVVVMRRHVLEETKGLSCFKQKSSMKEKGFALEEQNGVPLMARVLSNAYSICKHGECPDEGETFVRTANNICPDETVYRLTVGGFIPGEGMRISSMISDSPDKSGAVPAFSVKPFQPLSVERLAIDSNKWIEKQVNLAFGHLSK